MPSLKRYHWGGQVRIRGDESQGLFGRCAAVGAGADRRKTQQGQAGHGIPRGLGSVVVFLHAHEQVGGVGPALPEAAAHRVVEAFHHGVGQLDGEGEVGRIEGGFVEVDDAGQQVGISVEQLDRIALALAPSVVERAACLRRCLLYIHDRVDDLTR